MDTELFNFISFKEFARAFSSMLFLIHCCPINLEKSF